MIYIIFFLVALILSIIFTIVIRKVAIYLKILDLPTKDRKIHKKEIPLLGGVAIFLSFFITILLVKDKLIMGDLNYSHWIWFFIGACCLMVCGILDDKFELSPSKQIIWPLLAILCVLIGDIGIERVTNPFGGLIHLDNLKIKIFDFKNISYTFVFLRDIFTIFWLLAMMYTTKLLDGVDGLVTGISGIGGFIIFLFTITTKYYQPDIALVSLAFAGACFGFLIFNWHPAKIFLGEGGSLLLGYILGVLSIISGGKIAIALLILGIPLMDVVWIIIRRILKGKNPFRSADKKHLHHRLLDLGFGQRKTVLIFYLFALTFGLSALFLQSIGKMFAVVFLIVLMLIIIISFTCLDRKRSNTKL